MLFSLEYRNFLFTNLLPAGEKVGDEEGRGNLGKGSVKKKEGEDGGVRKPLLISSKSEQPKIAGSCDQILKRYFKIAVKAVNRKVLKNKHSLFIKILMFITKEYFY